MATFFRYWAPVCAYAGLIFYLSAQSHPDEDLPSFIDLFSDKVLHAAEYAVLGGLCYRAFRWGTTDAWRGRAVPLAILLAALYGVSDELHQWFVPFRDASWLDWLADAVGATIGAVGLARLPALRPVHSIVDAGSRR
ncbi:MAG TPA: VanZ family protein [Nitrospira sp.]|jgi:VanZ family protein|nr:VanZ family protein [Nitrospira sp.]